MKYEYKINLSFELGAVVGQVREIEESFNSTLATFGISDKLSVRSKGLSMVLRCNRKLFTEEREMIKTTILDQFREKFPTWNFQIISFRCKSFNQSRSQSQSR